MMRARIILVQGKAKLRQCEAPMVFGMISEKTKMSNVSTAETTPK